MLNLQPDLREGETVLTEKGATVYLVRGNYHSGGVNRRLWLTDQRLLLKAGLGPQRVWPLYTITDVGEQKLGWYTMVRIAFSSGYVAWLTVQDQAEFVQALEQARANAPTTPDPPPSPKALGPTLNRVLLIAVLAIAGVLACAALAYCAGSAVLLALLRWG
jgi:hypothetical protein